MFIPERPTRSCPSTSWFWKYSCTTFWEWLRVFSETVHGVSGAGTATSFDSDWSSRTPGGVGTIRKELDSIQSVLKLVVNFMFFPIFPQPLSIFHSPFVPMQPRHINSYSAAFRNQCLEVCRAVEAAYGADYTPAIRYLKALASNQLYRDAVSQPLPWLSTPAVAPGVGAPVYDLHPTVLQSLAPSTALRAMFGGRRNVWFGGPTRSQKRT